MKAIFGALFSLLFISACTTTVEPVSKANSHTSWGKMFLYSHALYGEPVFANDVVTFDRAMKARFGTPARTYKFGYLSTSLTKPDPRKLGTAIQNMATQADDAKDLVVTMFTSHGHKDVLAQKTPQQANAAGISAATLKQYLSPLQNDRHIIIIQACYSGSLIDDLRHPNRIIITASAADRNSFGCAPKADNTWFTAALNKSIRAGGSWEQIFQNTKALVRQDEVKKGINANSYSNPQVYVGRHMLEIWRDAS